MPKFNVKLKGQTKPIEVLAEKVDEDVLGNWRFMGEKGEVVANFDKKSVAGWWKEQDFQLSEVDIRDADRVVKELERPQMARIKQKRNPA